MVLHIGCMVLNPLTPKDPYIGRTAPLTSKRCILYIYSTNTRTEYFKHGIYCPFFSLQNAVCFIILTYLVPVLFTFYIQDVLKLKKKLNSGAKRLKVNTSSYQRPTVWDLHILVKATNLYEQNETADRQIQHDASANILVCCGTDPPVHWIQHWYCKIVFRFMLHEMHTVCVLWPRVSACFISQTTDRISIEMTLQV